MLTNPKTLFAALMFTGALLTFAREANAQAQPAPAPAQQEVLKPEQLDALVAPIALYSDSLLAEVLMASTYPLEVVEADRWRKKNKSLDGQQLKSAADKQGWDDSVKALTATPSVLDMMESQLDWTQKLGDAVLAQQPDVMDAVQRLRARAEAQNKLQSTKEQKVSTHTEQGKKIIVIEPAQPDTIYVPYYDPATVYGAWPYPDYPPAYWPPPAGYYSGAALAAGLVFTTGFAVGAWAANNSFWGGGMNWANNNINVNRNVNVRNVNNNWVHNPDHRHGVRYNNQNVANRFNRGNDVRNNAGNRMDFRGRNGEQVLNPGSRPGASAAGQRRDAGNRAANRGGDRARPSSANRPGARGAGERRQAGSRPGNVVRGRGGHGSAFSGVRDGGRTAMAQSARGRASMGARGGGGGGFRGGGHGGRRSDIRLKHDIARLGTLDNGLGFYRFSYIGSSKAYVGVIAQEVLLVQPNAVTRGSDGYLRVRYDRIFLKFQTYQDWISSGRHIPAAGQVHQTPRH